MQAIDRWLARKESHRGVRTNMYVGFKTCEKNGKNLGAAGFCLVSSRSRRLFLQPQLGIGTSLSGGPYPPCFGVPTGPDHPLLARPIHSVAIRRHRLVGHSLPVEFFLVISIKTNGVSGVRFSHQKPSWEKRYERDVTEK